jgi:hypothetical protein
MTIGTKPRNPPKIKTLAEVEKAHILKVFALVPTNAGRAKALGVSERTMYNLIKRYDKELVSRKAKAQGAD